MIEAQLQALNAELALHRMIVGPAFSTIADLVLKYGYMFSRQPLPKGRWQRGLGACYGNALWAARRKRYIYVEGYAISEGGSGLAQHHAWVTDPANPSVAYDPTWGQGVEYFGIPFRLEYVLTMFEKAGHPGLLDIFELGFPLVSGEHSIEDAIWRPQS